MAERWTGKEVTEAVTKRCLSETERLTAKGVMPQLAILRVGAREDDLAYERGAMKRCEAAGVKVRQVVLDGDVRQEDFEKALLALNEDGEVHGILMFRPLPSHLDEEKARQMLKPEKDVDGCTDASMAGVYANSGTGFAPCTAEAVVTLLDHYGVDVTGKKVAVIGRSLVIGRPVAMLLMHRNATVVNCHTRTVDVPSVTRKAEILIAAAGRAHTVTREYTNPDQIVVDVGINWDEEKGAITGDVDYENVAEHVRAITPVPGGVGGVTSSILVSHVVEAARRAAGD